MEAGWLVSDIRESEDCYTFEVQNHQENKCYAVRLRRHTYEAGTWTWVDSKGSPNGHLITPDWFADMDNVATSLNDQIRLITCELQ